MIYTSMKNGLQTETNEIQLLPIKKSIFQTEKIPMDMLQEEFFYRPSLEAVLNSVIPNYIGGYIYGALVESYCSEHNARMVAMQAANDSAQAMIHALSVGVQSGAPGSDHTGDHRSNCRSESAKAEETEKTGETKTGNIPEGV